MEVVGCVQTEILQQKVEKFGGAPLASEKDFEKCDR